MRKTFLVFVLLLSLVLACKNCEEENNDNDDDEEESENKKEEENEVKEKFKAKKEFVRKKEENSKKKYKSKKQKEAIEEYDFIVVGGGTAGCVVAARLSEISEFSVLVLEAGGKPPRLAQVPMVSYLAFANTIYDWNYTTVPQVHADNRELFVQQGKLLGGSLSISVPIWMRANMRDFELWEKMGVRGWQWKKFLRYYLRSETDYSTDSDDYFSGYIGPIKLTNPWKDVTAYKTFIDYFRKLDYEYVDPNMGTQTGFSIGRMAVYKSRVQSTYTSYLFPALSRKNLKVITHAVVEQILFNDEKEAVAVKYSKDGESFTVNARKEIILAAGAINTPKILMLSGIGPKKHLKSLNIDVISDLPVGDNLQDHPGLTGNLTKPAGKILNEQNLKKFLNDEGPLTNYSIVNAFVNTDLSTDTYYPDAQLFLNGHIVESFSKGNLIYQLWWQLNRPRSRGTVRLQSTDICDMPLIDPNYLNEEHDMQVFLRLAQNLAKVGKAIDKAQDEYSVSIFRESSCEHLNPKSDAYWRCIVKSHVGAGLEYCCTTPMNNPVVPGTVVDDNVRVIGVTKLRVVDASIFPTIPTASIQATVVAAAEKCSDLIKLDHVRRLYDNNHPSFNDSDTLAASQHYGNPSGANVKRLDSWMI